MTKHNISICMSTYNGARYIHQQIDSLLSQGYQDWKLFIRDDGSSDNTMNIVKGYVLKYPDKINLINDTLGQLGTSLSFGKILEAVDSDYYMFCDQDDVWLEQKIQVSLDLMKTTENGYPDKPILVHTDLRIVNAELKTISKSMWKYQGISPDVGNDADKVVFQNVATGCTVIINRKAKEVSLPVPKEAVMHDWWIAINVAKHGKIVYVPDQLVLYRQHPNNLVGAKKTPIIGLWLFFKNLFSLKKRILNYYRMVKKYDPNATFCMVVWKKILSEIALKFR